MWILEVTRGRRCRGCRYYREIQGSPLSGRVIPDTEAYCQCMNNYVATEFTIIVPRLNSMSYACVYDVDNI